MIPSRGLRGLRTAHIAQSASKTSSLARISASRQFSSLRRTCALSASSNRTSTLQSASWRACAAPRANQAIAAPSLRYASWWGKSTPPAPIEESPQAGETFNDQAQQAAATATPGQIPAGVDNAAIVDGSSAANAALTPHDSLDSTVADLLVDPTAPLAATPSAIDTSALITQVGALKDLGLDYGWGVAAFFEWLVEHVYVDTGLGWGSSIVLSALAIRVVGFFFLQVRASDNTAKVVAVQPVTKDLTEEMRTAMREGNQAKHMAARKRLQEIYKAVGAKPLAGMWPLGLQAALGFGAFRCLRGMTELPVPGLESDGFLWFENLVVSDPYYILPLATGAVMRVLLKSGGETGAQDQTNLQGAQVFMMYAMPVVITAITAFQPAALQMYFAVTTATGAVTAWILRSPSARKALNISPLPTKESKAFWTKVANGEIPIPSAGQDLSRMRYQAPTPIQPAPSARGSRGEVIQYRGLNVKRSGIPAHMPPAVQNTKVNKEMPATDVDFDRGPPKDLKGKVSWLVRNYHPRLLLNRSKQWIAANASEDITQKVLQRKKEIAKRKAEEFEARRRERMRK